MTRNGQGSTLEATGNMARYVHAAPGTNVQGCAFDYTVIEEGLVTHDGRDILYNLCEVKVGSPITGEGRFRFVEVPGYVLSYKSAEDSSGRPVSTLDPVSSKKEQESISQLFSGSFPGKQVRFSAS
ncbi:MAG: hypothetical protein ACOCWZ_05115 [Spirochaetota bacterium]